MAGTVKKISGPAFIAASATDVYTPPNAAVDVVIRHIHVANVTASSATFTAYVGATGGSSAGTELFDEKSVAAHEVYDWYGVLRLTSTQFLSAICETGASKLTITVSGEYVAN